MIEWAFLIRSFNFTRGWEREKRFRGINNGRDIVVDLYNNRSQIFYEIKHRTQRLQGLQQIQQRVELGLRPASLGMFGPEMWLMGPAPGLFLHAWEDPDQAGLILYEWSWETPPVVPLPFENPFTKRDRPSKLPKAPPVPSLPVPFRPVPSMGLFEC